NQYKQAAIDARIAALQGAKTRALQAYAGAEEKIEQQARSARNLASTTSQKGALDFARYLAQRGLRTSGAAAQGELARNVSLQGAMSDIERQRLADIAEVERARAGIEAGYEADVAAARAGVELDALRMAIDEARRMEELADE